MKQIFRLEMVVAEEDADRATGLLTLGVPFGWEEETLPTGETRFRVHCENPEFINNLQSDLQARIPAAEYSLTAIENQDWLAAWRQFFTPVPCGKRFVVLPPWLADSPDFPGREKIIIEPKSAFGTGHHATTALCLTVLSDLVDAGRVKAGQHFLDLGTGSGVLGIACCKSGLTGEGYDIDMLAVENAIENRGINGIDGFEVGLGSIDALEGRTYDLVLANILARPLIDLAPRIVWACKPGACLVLSGLLEIQADSVEEAYMAQCLPKPRRVIDGRVVRAGLGIGATLTVFVLAAAARAEVLSAPPVTLQLAGQTLPALLFAALLGFGAVLQVAGVYRPSRAAALIGAALVVCAGLFDRDPVLVVGQIVLVAALWPASKKKTGQTRKRRHSAG